MGVEGTGQRQQVGPRWSGFSELASQRASLEDGGEFGEGVEFDEVLAGGGGVDGGVLEDPGVFVEEEDGVESGGEGGVDVAFGAVADHPGAVRA